MFLWLFRWIRGVCTACGGRGEYYRDYGSFWGSWLDKCRLCERGKS